jgi:hypothetical protein
MKPTFLTALLGVAAISPLPADNLIWSDNFNVPDSASFDAASLTGRRGGFFPNEMVLRSANIQNQLVSQQLRLVGSSARVRFQVPPAGASYNFAAGGAGSQILSGGGIRVEFDYFPTNNTAANWISFSIGFPSSNLLPEPGGFRLNDPNTDFGFLLRNNGQTQFFKNGGGTVGGSFPATTTSRHVVITYGFTGLADLDSFTVVVTVDGTEVINQSHSWSNNSGQLLVEMGANEAGTLVDNFQIFERTPTRLGISLDDAVFQSSLTTGGDVGTLSALLGGVPGSATYELVAGTGDTDNAKFQITGDKLEVGGFDFSGPNSTEGQQYSVRVRGTSTGAGAQTDEKVLVLTIVKDDDADGLLDAWEIANTAPPGNITDLNGNGIADFDGDGLTDLAEYQISLGTNTTYPGAPRPVSPILADTDDDGLGDKTELDGTNNPYLNASDPVGAPPSGPPGDPTQPTVADSDGDGIKDGEEVVAGADTFVTNPTRADTDGDKLGDGFEVTNLAAGYSPLVDDSLLDTDGDTLTTADEVFYGSSPILVDTDGDTLRDDEEVFPTGSRPPTLPFRADSDFDGLSDLVETNTGSFAGVNDRGTNPVVQDTDGDGSRDGFEVDRGSDPLVNASRPPLPAGFSVVTVTDATSGISSAKTYTHAIAGGEPATVNGVAFQTLNTALTPSNFTWFIDGVLNDGRNHVSNNNNQWVPANAGLTDPGLIDLFDSFSYSGGGADPGSFQTFTLGGLTPGVQYDVRLYIRVWDKGFSGRPQDLIFTNGAQVVQPFGALLEDRPGIVTASENPDTAYYLSFVYTAEGTELKIESRVPLGAAANSGSFHLYGLTNEVVGSDTPFRITQVARNGLGELVIDFVGMANTTYRVTKSPDLQSGFGPLATPLTATTDGAGIGQAIVPAAEASEAREFYRIEDQ